MPDRRQLSDAARTAAVFDGIDDALHDEMLREAAVRDYAADQAVFTQGAPAEQFFLVDAGSIKLVQASVEGRETIHRFVRPGQVMAAVALLPDSHYPVTALATEPSRVASWSNLFMRRQIQRYPRLHANIMSAMATHMQDTLVQSHELATSAVPQRLAGALLRLAERSGTTVADGVEIDQPLSREEIAEMTGTTLFTVSRTLSEWQDAGIISTRRKHVVVHDRERLAQIALAQ